MPRRRRSPFTLRSECAAQGFKEIPFSETGIEKATTGNTVLVLCYDRVSADNIQRSYYMKLSEAKMDYISAASYRINFRGGGKIVIIYATKKHDFSQYDETKTYFRIDYRR
jgi:hypothetical protein